MPVKNDAESDEVSETNSSQEEASDEEANEVDSDDSSLEMDVCEIERRRTEYIEYLSNLEQQFTQLREQYYVERMTQFNHQLGDVRSGLSEEYLHPLKELHRIYEDRIKVADILREYRLENIEHKYLSELQAARQHFESEKQLAFEQIKDDLLEKIRQLEEDRHNVDITWEDWGTDKRASKVRGPGRKKPVTVTGPYIVYMLREEDILEDWTIIRKAMKRSTLTTGT